MRKLSLFLLGSLLLCGCQNRASENDTYFAAPQVLSESKLEGEPVAAETKAKPVKVAEPLAAKSEPTLENDSAYEHFLRNVVIKRRSPNFITYEYKEIRVDELSPLAARYCRENGNRTAVLRSVILFKNYSRRATFDCLNLQ